ncbi:MAG TPA: phenylalanine--tRNA ligase subunit beta [Ktedonobacterales bacterium]
MKTPYSWLKEYVEIADGPEALAERLTMAGLEVDRVAYAWPGVVIAEIVHLERVKGSDHLSATRVTTGTGRELSVVCGAPNIKLHDRVPLARVGTKIGAVTIQPKRAMGVLSEGMLCSPRELGISDDHDGILILPPDTPLGVPLGSVLSDAVIELDIKAHRGDLFCMVGVAREIAAFSGKKLKPPKIKVAEQGTPAADLMTLEVRDADLCPRYTARVVRGVRVGPSPAWMAERLTLAGMRPINNVVDITNYVMLELGQPLHAFDYDKVADHSIVVRRAAPGERITTLDGVDRALTSDMLLITDPAGPNVIAGIFGGERCEVSDATANVLLEAAHFNPISIRRTSQAVGLRTESSGRFEKNPDIELTAVAIDRAAQLLTELAGGTVAPGRVDFYPKPTTARRIRFDTEQVAWLTAMQVPPSEAIAALRALGFAVAPEADQRYLRVTVPSWRGDVEESADLVEEVARIAGYDRIPSTIPTGPLPEPMTDNWFWREERVRDILVGAGLTEVITYALTSRGVMARLFAEAAPGSERLLTAPTPSGEADSGNSAGDQRADGGRTIGARGDERRQLEAIAERLPAIVLRNSLTSELDALRLTLMSGLLTTLYENGKYSDAGLWFFELGRRYLSTPELAAGTGLAQERRSLGMALLGPAAQRWDAAARAADFYDLKGVAEALLRALHISSYRFVPVHHPTFHPGRCALLEVAPAPATETPGGDTQQALEAMRWARVGVLGEVHPVVAARFDSVGSHSLVDGRPYLMELDLEQLFSAIPTRQTYQPLSRFPAVQRDLAIVVERGTLEAEVAAAMRPAGEELVREVRLFDVYTGEGVDAAHKSLAYRLTYQSAERTLTDADVDAAQQRVLDALAKQFKAVLRT